MVVFEVLESFEVDGKGLFHPVVLVRFELFHRKRFPTSDKGGVLILRVFSDYIRTSKKVKYQQFDLIDLINI